jgi:two-component system sensor histidine kinase MtrB
MVATMATGPRTPLGLRARTALALAGGALLVSLTMGLVSFWLARGFLIERRLTEVEKVAFVNAQFIDRSVAEDSDVVGGVVAGLADPAAAILVAVDNQWFGAVVGVGERDVPTSLSERVDAGEAAVELIELGDGSPQAVVGLQLPQSGAQFYQLVSLSELASTLNSLQQALAIAVVISTAAGAVFGLIVSRRIVQPIRVTAAAATKIAEGELSTRLPVEDDPDLAALVTAFNDMAESLEQRIQRERRFAADVSHELRTPLTALGSAVQIVVRRSDDLGPGGQKAVEVIESQITHFQQLVLEILDLSRIEAGLEEMRPGLLNVRRFLEALISEFEPNAPALDVDAAVPLRVLVDRRRLRLIVRNLLENAKRYAGGATRLGVRVDDERILFEVDDAGPGLTPEECVVIFERFRRGSAATSSSAPRGTGLGLALVHENVKMMDGNVTAESSPAGGARFVIVLPLVSVEEDDPVGSSTTGSEAP